MIFRWYLEGRGEKEIVKRLNREGALTREGSHEAIIDRRTFEQAQAMYQQRRKQALSVQHLRHTYHLSGLLRCGHCGAAMSGASAKSGKNLYYACHNYLKRGTDACDAGLIPRDELELFVRDKIQNELFTDSNSEQLGRVTAFWSQSQGQAVLNASLDGSGQSLDSIP